ncbi:c-type cytochrome [Ramlibacter aurantiacus]|uniref:c-type cytochrome n=1 Tax=Ramlibacter aurantiacus TaxID=2801330 RepID=UPI001F2E2ECF|nr:cytochrome c [Ramlibacter aurantiacus]
MPSRGELLYDNHCIECHSTQMHWRDQRLATDWSSLKAQVRRWQATAHLGWSEEDIDAVTRHLNETIYRYPPPRQSARLDSRHR